MACSHTRVAVDSSTFGQLFPEANLRNRYPRFNCGVGSCNFTGYPSGWLNDGKDYAWSDNLTMMRGKHTYKVGVYFNLDDKQQQPSWNDAGNFDFSTTKINPNDANNGQYNGFTVVSTSNIQGSCSSGS